MDVEKEIRELAVKYSDNLKAKIDARVEEMQSKLNGVMQQPMETI